MRPAPRRSPRQAASTILTSQLRTALASRAVIDRALGVIMAQERCTQAQAFAILRSASQHRNVTLPDIATRSSSASLPSHPSFPGEG
jgi:AmiR/NasT family two-component response regulator